MNAIAAAWRSAFGDLPPAGWRLRHALAPLWMRVHALPQSKRYPDTWGEWRTLWRRHRAVGDAVLGAGARVAVLAFPDWASYRHRARPVTRPPRLSEARLFLRAAAHVDEPDWRVRFEVAQGHWTFEAWRDLISEIAHDRRQALWFNPARRTVFAPYDGGIDVIAATPRQRALLISRFSGWMSDRADML